MLDWKEPLPLQGVIDRGVALFHATLPSAYPLAFGVVLASDYALRLVFGGHQAEIDALAKAGDFATIGERFGAGCFAFALFSLWASNALLHFIGAQARGWPHAPFASLGVALRAYPQLFVATLIFVVTAWAGLLALVVPGLFVAVAWSFYAQAVLFDDKDAWRALTTSHRLTRGSWWRTLGFFVVLLFGALCASLVSGVALGLVTAMLKAFGAGAIAPDIDFLLGSAIGAVITIAIDAMLIAWYHDLGLRAGAQPRDASFAA